jgi:hypothetical protein
MRFSNLYRPSTARVRRARFFAAVLAGFMAAFIIPRVAQADGIIWPTNQLLPTFSTPAAVLDCIDISSASGAEIDLFSSLQGIVNRIRPRIICVSSGDGEGKFTWLNIHNLPYSLINGYSAITKYQTNVTGLVVNDTSQPDTLNLATTIAGVKNELICNPALLATLTNAPYNLPVVDDLRGQFSNKYQVYGYLYTNYWTQCTHRLVAGLETNLDGNLRDYLVAMKVATVWLDPGPGNLSDQSTLGPFVSDMTAANGVYIGWWPSEGNGLGWIGQYGIPVLASDYLRNASVYGGAVRPINVPPIPPPPPLQNKIYVSLILSDGDNIQYMQHAMKINWNNAARGSVPIGWTVSPLAADADPGMLNYYWNTASKNDCLISGPSGAGYAHVENWTAANLMSFAKVSSPYLQRGGLKVITIWDQVTGSAAAAFATNCPTLMGLTDQSGGAYTSVNNGLGVIGLAAAYFSSTNAIISSITNAAQNWSGTAPMFIAAQAVVWNLGPADLRNIANSLDTNKYVMVRPDQLFMLYNRIAGNPLAVTTFATKMTATTAVLQGAVIPNATNAIAWLEWGTNNSYGAKGAVTNVSGVSVVTVGAAISGLTPRTIYHYRVAVSNALGTAFGADKIFTTGGRLKAWGDDGLGEINPPPGQTNVVGISCGAYHGLALKNDGGVLAWGYNGFGQTDLPADLTNVVQVAGGMQHSLALKSDGTVAAWGGNAYGQTNVPAGLDNSIAVAAGGYHSLALKSDGTVAAWGENNFGQTNVPSGLSNVVAIAAGQYHSVALKVDGTINAWGNNSFGQTNVLAGLNNVVAIGAGQYHSLAQKIDGLLYTNLNPTCEWIADNLSGSDGSPVSSWPDDVAGKNATQTKAGNQPALYSNVLNGHKTVRFSGAGRQYLTVVAADSPITGTGSFTLAVVFKTSTAGNVSTNFYQNTGLLGAEQTGVVNDWTLCVNGSQLGAGLGAGGNGCGPDLSLYGGNVTDGNPHVAMYVRSGDTITLYLDGVIVAAQSSLCAAERGNYDFQIGAMTTNLYFFSGDIAEIQLLNRALSDFEITTANEILAETYGIKGAANEVVVWGSNSGSQTNVPLALTNVLTTASGSDFNLAVTGNGTIAAWGDNSLGQLTALPGLTNVTALCAGNAFTLAIGNQTPLASNTTVAGYVNHDLTFALPGRDPDDNPLSFRILSLPAFGALYQYLSGGRGLPISSANTPISDPAGQVVFAPGAGATGTPYVGVEFIAQDSFYNSTPAVATINIGLPAAPQFDSLAWEAGEGGFNLELTGASNATYSLWASSNFFTWINIGTATETSPGLYQFVDTMTNWLQKFYRASAP